MQSMHWINLRFTDVWSYNHNTTWKNNMEVYSKIKIKEIKLKPNTVHMKAGSTATSLFNLSLLGRKYLQMAVSHSALVSSATQRVCSQVAETTKEVKNMKSKIFL